jgi:hypothetical protein
MAMAEVGCREMGFVQRIAVEPHLTICSVEVLPEAEWQAEVVTNVDQAVEGESQLVVIQELSVAERSISGRPMRWARAASRWLRVRFQPA